MTTQRQAPPSDPNAPPVPLPDPEAIIRENRRLQHISRPDPATARLAASQLLQTTASARARTDQPPPATPTRTRTEPSTLPDLLESSEGSPLL